MGHGDVPPQQVVVVVVTRIGVRVSVGGVCAVGVVVSIPSVIAARISKMVCALGAPVAVGPPASARGEWMEASGAEYVLRCPTQVVVCIAARRHNGALVGNGCI